MTRSLESDTRTLLRTGGAVLSVGVVSAALLLTVFGGVTRQGPHTNGGWLMLMIVMGCLPMGLLLLLLGVAKLGRKAR